jgi:hypothetical protein
VDIKRADLEEEFDRYQHYYNWQRAHRAHNGKTPMERCLEVSRHTPFREEVQASYDPGREFIRYTDYRIDLKLMKFRRNNQANS